MCVFTLICHVHARARLLGRRQDAWRPLEVGQGLDARALALCGLQHRLRELALQPGLGDGRGFELLRSLTC